MAWTRIGAIQCVMLCCLHDYDPKTQQDGVHCADCFLLHHDSNLGRRNFASRGMGDAISFRSWFVSVDWCCRRYRPAVDVTAYRNAPAVVISPFSYSAIIWATIFGYMFWQEQLGIGTVCGTATIVVSGLWLARHETRRSPDTLPSIN